MHGKLQHEVESVSETHDFIFYIESIFRRLWKERWNAWTLADLNCWQNQSVVHVMLYSHDCHATLISKKCPYFDWHPYFLSYFPVSSAFVERVFFLVSARWMKERNSFGERTVKSILQVKVHVDMNCSEMHQVVSLSIAQTYRRTQRVPGSHAPQIFSIYSHFVLWDPVSRAT